MPIPYTAVNAVASAAAKTGPGIIHTATLTGGSDAATLIVYANTAASGTIIVKLAAAAGATAHALLDAAFGPGCYMALTGTAPSATVTLI